MFPDLRRKCHEVVMFDEIALKLQAISFLQQILVLDWTRSRIQVQGIAHANRCASVLNDLRNSAS